MKKHNGMRPHDVVILLKIAAKSGGSWYMKDLSHELGISASEVSESLNRSALARLISQDKKQLMNQALLEFLEHGLKYVYPVQPGAVVRGMPTAHSAAPLSNEILSDEIYVWPWAKGNERGQEIQPLHSSVPEACKKDEKLYQMLALVDALRVGRKREQQLAGEILRKIIEQA
jgi:predicted transcriptional regulator